MASSNWALFQISHILPLDEQSLRELLDYTSTLSKDASADHLRNLLGTSPKALEFISSYNSRREAPVTEPRVSSTATPEPPVPHKKPRKNKQPLNKPFNPRQPENYGNTTGGYHKKDEDDYVSGRRQQAREPALANALALSDKPEARQLPIPAPTSGSCSPRKPPSASGPLITDLPNVRTGSRTSSRTSSPAPKTKVNVPGGASMHGASSTLQDLDSAIRALELQTNPALTKEPTPSRACSCNATKHPLLTAAPNCLSCGKIICVKEGIGPCTFCSHPLLSSTEINSMIRALREERGKERMSTNNATHRRADLATTPRPFTSTNTDGNPTTSSAGNTSASADPGLAAAQQHRDKLLSYQSQNARRTHIIDEAADFDTPVSGQNIWASPTERAKQLKRQQKVLREQEWNAKPDWEKRKVVVSIDVVGGKAVRRMEGVERPKETVEVGEENDLDAGVNGDQNRGRAGKGAFSRNPLMGGLIRPVWKGKEAENNEGTGDGGRERQEMKWRRVQDDDDDNEAWILDGGIYGGREDVERRLGDEEHAFG
ncbi:MAG: hypothetical protein LQ343_000786 [Gyalolechia ehrenbergii]|nr:MAG: hypothetical protein LQ343_000786 [Gyalolechia ehrenbergii]